MIFCCIVNFEQYGRLKKNKMLWWAEPHQSESITPTDPPSPKTLPPHVGRNALRNLCGSFPLPHRPACHCDMGDRISAHHIHQSPEKCVPKMESLRLSSGADTRYHPTFHDDNMGYQSRVIEIGYASTFHRHIQDVFASTRAHLRSASPVSTGSYPRLPSFQYHAATRRA